WPDSCLGMRPQESALSKSARSCEYSLADALPVLYDVGVADGVGLPFRSTSQHRGNRAMDIEDRRSVPSRREHAMKGGDAASLLARMPERYSHVVREWAGREPSRLAVRA